MSGFSNGFNFGFLSGMFNGMFGGFNPFMGFNSFNNWNWGWNSLPTFYTPNFTSFQSSIFNMSTPTMWNFNTTSTPSVNYPSFDFPSVNFQPTISLNTFDTFTRTTVAPKSNEPEIKAPRTSGDFDKMLKFVLDHEGRYVPNDCGQAANKGIQQSTYNEYRRKRGLPKKDVKNITDAEVKDCYYNDFYIASGASKIKDAKLALYVFDAAVNMGVGAAKELYSKCGNSAEKFNELRLAKYNHIAKNNPDKRQYLKGWKNRVSDSKTYANKEFVA